MPYSPKSLPTVSGVQELLGYVEEELRSVAREFSETTMLFLRPVYRAPDKPREGMTVYADGTTWNPSNGAGPYSYIGGVWSPLAVPLPYSSGTWTPTLAGQTTAGAQTYSVQEGFWRLVGDLCFVNWRLTMTAKDGATAGNLLLKGLPFASMSAGHANQAITLAEWSNLTLGAGFTDVTLRINLGSTDVLFIRNGSGVAADVISSATGLAAGTEVCGSGVYRVS